ncbi:alpha/beta hydrolase [Chryseosolibacter indicus]|nr:alpha/beta hydrolase-fold protein [Chryseosolibacter indicus]
MLLKIVISVTAITAILCGKNNIESSLPGEGKEGNMVTQREVYRQGRLMARPKENLKNSDGTVGLQQLKLDKGRDGLMYVPKGYNKDSPAALAVMLHGAGGNAEHGLALIRAYADENNIILLAPSSRGQTWDIIANDGFDRDVIYIDQALEHVFNTYSVDTSRIAIGGFSDGASYALCLGLTNGDLFTHVIAFSPGFFYTILTKGKPRIFISHGTRDSVLPIDPCSRRIVPRLKQQSVLVDYNEFDGGHEIPKGVSQASIRWFLKNE